MCEMRKFVEPTDNFKMPVKVANLLFGFQIMTYFAALKSELLVTKALKNT